MNNDPKPTNWCRCALLAMLALIALGTLNVAYLAKNNWEIRAEGKYVKMAREAMQTLPILEAKLATNQVAMSDLSTANKMLLSDYNGMAAELQKSLEAAEKVMVIRGKQDELRRQKDNSKCLEILMALNEMTILFRGTTNLTIEQMPGKNLKCPLGGKFLMGDSLHVSCTHTNPSLATYP